MFSSKNFPLISLVVLLGFTVASLAALDAQQRVLDRLAKVTGNVANGQLLSMAVESVYLEMKTNCRLNRWQKSGELAVLEPYFELAQIASSDCGEKALTKFRAADELTNKYRQMRKKQDSTIGDDPFRLIVDYLRTKNAKFCWKTLMYSLVDSMDPPLDVLHHLLKITKTYIKQRDEQCPPEVLEDNKEKHLKCINSVEPIVSYHFLEKLRYMLSESHVLAYIAHEDRKAPTLEQSAEIVKEAIEKPCKTFINTIGTEMSLWKANKLEEFVDKTQVKGRLLEGFKKVSSIYDECQNIVVFGEGNLAEIIQQLVDRGLRYDVHYKHYGSKPEQYGPMSGVPRNDNLPGKTW